MRLDAGEIAGVAGTILLTLFFIGAAWGWVWNIIKIFHTISDPITGMFIFRCVGILFAPLGAILGFM